MLLEELEIGYHVSRKEHLFVVSVGREMRRLGYGGPIQVVGSREKGSRISTKTYHSSCQDLDPNEYEHWLGLLNLIVRNRDISAGETIKAVDYLPKNTPPEVRNMFERRGSHLDSDLDIAITEERQEIKPSYEDILPPEGSGLVIEVYEPGDYSYLKVSPFNY